MTVDAIWTEEPGIQLIVDQELGGWIELRYIDVGGPERRGRLLSSFRIAPHRVARLIRALGCCIDGQPPVEA